MRRGRVGVEPVEWVFDPLPASGARRGGDPASHVFRQTIASFVREIVQNANDQRTEAPEVHFRFVELQGSDLERFFKALSWSSLRPHLEASAATRGGRALEPFLKDLDDRKRLIVLVVEDRNTIGLTGSEFEGDSHFRALCKDTLFSHKQSEGAGGSYGLGKSVLWAFSGLSTVLFNSILSHQLTGQISPRLFGRAELPSHELDTNGHGFTGSGWFGLRVHDHAESVWAERAAELASALHLQRKDAEVTGTSIAIVGFRDPTSDIDRTVDELDADIERAVERDFWPALVMPGTPLTVWIVANKKRPLFAQQFHSVRPFVECYQHRASTRTRFEVTGDVVVREIEFDLPARRDGTAAVKGHVRLCVRLGDESERGAGRSGSVAWFRGPGMVVQYTDKRRLALGARPFHAIVACGNARNPESPTPSDVEVERFLRAAEPPGHDVWESTAALKAEYRPGYAKALEQLRQRVDEALKQIVIAQPRSGRQGPDRLRRLFPIGRRGGPGSGPSSFHVRGLMARFAHGQWTISGEVKPSIPLAEWHCTLSLREAGDDDTELDVVPLARIDVGAASSEIVDGVARIHVSGPALNFEGTTQPTPLRPGGPRAVTLEVKSTTRGTS